MSARSRFWFAIFFWSVPLIAEIRISGLVVSDTNTPLANASIIVRRAGADEIDRTVTDPAGAFSFMVPEAGEYFVDVERTGFFSLRRSQIRIDTEEHELRLVLNPIREHAESVDVSEPPLSVGMDEAVSGQQVSGKELMDIPQATTHNVKSAMRAIPGVVQDARGGVHINGGAEYQSLYLLDGFNISDPLTGTFETRLSVESVQSMTILSGQLPAQYGKGSAGVVAIETKTGDDRFRYTATNFVPGLTYESGWRIGSWTPRANISGPIRRGRAWFSESLLTQYDQSVIRDLPRDQNKSSSLRYTNLFRTQVNLTPSNILSGEFLASAWTARRSGLSALDPPETTTDRRSRQWFVGIRDQMYFGRGALVELGYGMNRTFFRQIPQGHDFYVMTPNGRSGNYYVDELQRSSRDQVLTNVFLPSFTLMGGHQVKVGADLNLLTYDQDTRRTGFEVYSAAQEPIRKITYGGSGIVSRSNFEAASYLQDSWRIRKNVLLEIGIRADRDRLLGSWSVSPRAAVAWAPARFEYLKFSAGYAVTHDATRLQLFTQPYDQYAITTWFPPYGTPELTNRSFFVIPGQNYAIPRFSIWTASVDHRIGSRTFVNFQAMRRRGSRGLVYSGAAATDPGDSLFELRNGRTDAYDSVGVTVRTSFRKEYEWLGSYIRSAARSSAVFDLSSDTRALIDSNLGRMSWDTPHRLLSWGYLPTFWKNWAVAYLLETRSGFPHSIENDTGAILGNPNSRRYPVFFELNLHVERKFRFRQQLWAARLGFNNITSHRNPNTVINNVDSDRFLQYFGGQGRALVVRIRWLGKV